MKRIYDITVGYQCNLNCRFCSVGLKRKDLKKNTNQIKADILHAKNEGIPILGFGGGEPTIRKDIFEIIRFAKQLGFEIIRIQTNGVMFGYEKFTEKIIQAGANYFKFSIHGHNAKIHDYLTQVDGSFDMAMKGIDNLKKQNKSVEINIVLNKKNYLFLPQMVSYFIKKDISKFCIIFPTVVGNAKTYSEELIPKVSEVKPYVEDALEMIEKLGLDKGLSFNIPFCILEKYNKRLIENSSFNTLISNPEKVEDIDEERHLGKSKGPDCKKCIYDSKCLGVWNNYLDLYGFEEFKPILPDKNE